MQYYLDLAWSSSSWILSAQAVSFPFSLGFKCRPSASFRLKVFWQALQTNFFSPLIRSAIPVQFRVSFEIMFSCECGITIRILTNVWLFTNMWSVMWFEVVRTCESWLICNTFSTCIPRALIERSAILFDDIPKPSVGDRQFRLTIGVELNLRRMW